MKIVKVSFLNTRIFYFTINFIVIFLLSLTISRPSWSLEPLKLGVHPFLSYMELEKKFAPLAAYLSQEIGRPVVVRVGSSYQEHIDAIGRDQLDIAYLGPVGYVLLVNKYGSKPLIVCQETNGSPFFKGIIFVRNDHSATSLADLGAGEFAFVISKVGVATGSIDTNLYSLIMAVTLVTMFLTPFISRTTAPIYGFIKSRRQAEPVLTINVARDELHDHVVVAGSSRDYGTGRLPCIETTETPY